MAVNVLLDITSMAASYGRSGTRDHSAKINRILFGDRQALSILLGPAGIVH